MKRESCSQGRAIEVEGARSRASDKFTSALGDGQTTVDSLQTSVATMMMAAVPVDVKHQTDRLDYCCYGEACLVPPPSTRAKQEGRARVLQSPQPIRATRYAIAP
jgi:hypothetical protein